MVAEQTDDSYAQQQKPSRDTLQGNRVFGISGTLTYYVTLPENIHSCTVFVATIQHL